MAAPGNAVTTATAIGQREDVTDLIANIDPTETPVLSMSRPTTAKAVTHEWLIDSLRDPSVDRATLEGDIVGEGDNLTATTVPVQKANTCQINTITYGVSGTVEVVGKYGRDSELAYEGAKSARDLKNSVDYDIGGRNQVKVTAGTRKIASIMTYISNCVGGTAAVGQDGTTTVTLGGESPFVQADIDAAQQQAYADGAKPTRMVTTALQKANFATFDGIGNAVTASVTRSDRQGQTIYANADVYVGNFGTLEVLPSRHCHSVGGGDTVFLIDPEYLKIAYLRPWQQFDLAKIGDSMRREMLVEFTPEVCNPGAHAIIVARTN